MTSDWRPDRAGDAVMESAQHYWQRQFRHSVELTPLPFDRSRPPVPAYLRGHIQLSLAPHVADRVCLLGARLDVSTLTILLAALKTVLVHYGSAERTVVGVVGSSGDVPGDRAPALPIQTDWSSGAELSGQELILKLARQMAEASDHADFSLQDLTFSAGAQDTARGARLFNVALCERTSEPGQDGTSVLDPGALEFLTQCDLVIGAPPACSMLQCDFDSELFEPATIERLLGHVSVVLEGILAEPSASVLGLPILTGAERQELSIERSRATESFSSATLTELFEAQVERTPDRLALTGDGGSLTYRELNHQANRLARRLVECGVKPDTLVGLCLDRSIDLVVSLLAILKSGGAYLPIDLAYPPDRLAFMLDDAQAPVLLTVSKLAATLPQTEATVLYVDQFLAQPVQDGEEANLPSLAGPDNLAYVIYTSGTTGKPKGSLITHSNVTRLFHATRHWFGFNDQDVWTLFHSTAFDFSVWEIWGAFLYGGRVVVVPYLVSRSPEAFYELLAKEGVTVLNQTPSAFRQLIQAEESIGPKALALRYVIFGGEALEMQSLKPWFDRHGDRRPVLVNMYGITETTVHVTYRPLSIDDVDSGSVIGVPIPDLQVHVLNQYRQPMPVGVAGEMYVGGAGLARGYLNRADLTEERFIPDHLTGRPGARLYKTGDLARMLPSGDIEYLGRIDHQVKIRGFRIELGEIESVLCHHPTVREAVVVARQDEPGIKRLVAYLVVPPPIPGVSELREHLKRKLPDYMVPAAFVFLEKFPLTASGKIDRKALPAPELHHPELGDHYVAPQTELEKALAAIWSKVLRVERVGVNDNFFELGGDSILGIQTISLARREGLKLTPTLLFAHPTIANLAAATESVNPQISQAPRLVSGDVSLTPIQHWFFEQDLAEAHHYNQAFFFEVTSSVPRGMLERALEEVSRQHDSLRLRCVRGADGWHQSYSTSDEAAPLTWVDLSGTPEHDRRRSMEAVAASIQSTLDFGAGPLWRAAYFDLGPDRPGRLLLAIHHLSVDGVSWRVLIEDLEAACQQLQAGVPVKLPLKTSSLKDWSERLHQYAATESVRRELPYWKAVVDRRETVLGVEGASSDDAHAKNIEGSCRTLKVALTATTTQALLQQVPSTYNTQINDVLLTALARAWSVSSGSRVLFTNLEGHGRENLFEDVDLSRTVGWFTSVFPVRLEMPAEAAGWRPGEALKAIKEQLRQVPQRGIGYGILRYLCPDIQISASPDPFVVFNYLGQFDQVVAGSTLFRFASESTGPWHSPKQRRRHALEVNGLVINNCLETWWTYSENLHAEKAILRLAEAFIAALEELVAHCVSPDAGGYTVSDFPLARLDQSTLDQLVGGRRDIEDIYPLSPMQTLFYSANPGAVLSVFDHWHCTLRGTLNQSAFQRAWQATVRRHAILRSTVHGDGLVEPRAVVHRDVRLPWTIDDWRATPAQAQTARWAAFVKDDLAKPLNLVEAPAMRFALVRLADDTWKFLWSVPSLLMDGWSWPVVFRDASRLYESFSQDREPQLEPVRPYRDYLDWLGRQSTAETTEFWRDTLSGLREPTPVPTATPEQSRGGERHVRRSIRLSHDTTRSLQRAAREMRLTLNTLVQGAWAILLNRRSGSSDVVFGAAFAGRPTDLPGAESIVGPFVNNLPVRVTVDRDSTIGDFFADLHERLLRLNAHQFLPLMEIQRSSEMPWRHRLFDSVVVFQNYTVEESARRFGQDTAIEEFEAPIHSSYPVMLLAEPQDSLRLTVIYDREIIAAKTVEEWGRDLELLMEQIPTSSTSRISELQDQLLPPVIARIPSRAGIRAELQSYIPPQTEMERRIAGVVQGLFEVERVSTEENFFDLGGHSLLLVQLHRRLKDVLKVEFSIVTLFEYPSVRSLARRLGEPAVSAVEAGGQFRDRADKQKHALAALRTKLKQEGK